jgi:hypothetical protein
MALQSFNAPNSDAARQHLLDKRSERKHPKRHRTRKRSAKIKAARKARAKAKAAEHRKVHLKFKSEVRSYWSGESDNHPERP